MDDFCDTSFLGFSSYGLEGRTVFIINFQSHALHMSLSYKFVLMISIYLFCSVEAVSKGEAIAKQSPFGRIEHEVKSDYSHIRIRRKKNFRTMLFVRDDGSEVGETVINMRQPYKLIAPYTQTMFASFFFKQQQKRVLIVGLGGGSMIHFLKRYQPKTKIDVVEIDPEVVRIAKKYFRIKKSKTVTLITEDAFKFFPECKQKYDVIYMDAFLKPSEQTDGTGAPLKLKTVKFLESLQKNLTAEGLVVFNLNIGKMTKEDIKTIRQVFVNTYVFAVPNSESVIVIGSISKTRQQFKSLTTVARSLDRKFRTNFSFKNMLRNLNQAASQNHQGNSDTEILRVLHTISLIRN